MSENIKDTVRREAFELTLETTKTHRDHFIHILHQIAEEEAASLADLNGLFITNPEWRDVLTTPLKFHKSTISLTRQVIEELIRELTKHISAVEFLVIAENSGISDTETLIAGFEADEAGDEVTTTNELKEEGKNNE